MKRRKKEKERFDCFGNNYVHKLREMGEKNMVAEQDIKYEKLKTSPPVSQTKDFHFVQVISPVEAKPHPPPPGFPVLPCSKNQSLSMSPPDHPLSCAESLFSPSPLLPPRVCLHWRAAHAGDSSVQSQSPVDPYWQLDRARRRCRWARRIAGPRPS